MVLSRNNIEFQMKDFPVCSIRGAFDAQPKSVTVSLNLEYQFQ